jgi:hypothetical protein
MCFSLKCEALTVAGCCSELSRAFRLLGLVWQSGAHVTVCGLLMLGVGEPYRRCLALHSCVRITSTACLCQNDSGCCELAWDAPATLLFGQQVQLT